MAARISFVGAGPGAADLITIRGARLLRHADVVIFAGSLVDLKLVQRYATRADVFDSAGMTLPEVITVMVDATVSGRSVSCSRKPSIARVRASTGAVRQSSSTACTSVGSS